MAGNGQMNNEKDMEKDFLFSKEARDTKRTKNACRAPKETIIVGQKISSPLKSDFAKSSTRSSTHGPECIAFHSLLPSIYHWLVIYRWDQWKAIHSGPWFDSLSQTQGHSSDLPSTLDGP
mgnify:CR=1 FL=1